MDTTRRPREFGAIASEVAVEGISIVEGVIGRHEIADLRTRADELLEEHGLDDDWRNDDRPCWVLDPLEHAEDLRWIINFDPPRSVARLLFGPALYLDCCEIRITSHGMPDQPWHRDACDRRPYPMPLLWSPRQSLSAILYLEDTEGIGGFEYVPASHRDLDDRAHGTDALYPFDGYTSVAEPVLLHPRAGDMLLFTAGLLHRGLANPTSKPRRTLAGDWTAGTMAPVCSIQATILEPAVAHPCTGSRPDGCSAMKRVALLERAQVTFDRRLATLDDAAWEQPTQIPDVDLRALVNHVVAGNTLAVLLLSGAGRISAEAAVCRDLLGDRPLDAWRKSAVAELEAFMRPAALEVNCLHPLADVSGSELLTYRTVDLVLHTADVAAAVGAVQEFPLALIAEARAAVPLMKRLLEPSALTRLTRLVIPPMRQPVVPLGRYLGMNPSERGQGEGLLTKGGKPISVGPASRRRRSEPGSP